MDSMTLWYAVSRNGQGRVFTSPPTRDEHFKIWMGDSIGAVSVLFMLFEGEGMQVPELRWEDDPVEFELIIRAK